LPEAATGRGFLTQSGTYITRKGFGSMTTIWGRPCSNVPALRLGSLELCDLLSRELDNAHAVLDEWDFARASDALKPAPASRARRSDRQSARWLFNFAGK
jgi:hypothetical protein